MDVKTTTKGPILIAHLADVHLRDTQYSTRKRGEDFYAAFERALHVVEKADCAVMVGDNFDNPRPSARMIAQMMKADGILRKMGKPMFSVTGNHDWSSPTWLSTLFPDREGESSGIVPLDGRVEEVGGNRIVGLQPYTARQFRENIAEIEETVRDADVVLYHGFVKGIVPLYAGQGDHLELADLPFFPGHKAWLLGDIHVQGYASVARPGDGKNCIVGYPGSLEMCSRSEPKEKSVPLIRIDGIGRVEKVVDIRTRRHVTARVIDEESLDNLLEELRGFVDDDPVVLVEFARSLPQAVNRIHTVLDPQKAIIRCYPLSETEAYRGREAGGGDDEPSLEMEYFINRKFSDDPDLNKIALDLFHRGEADSHNILSEVVENRLQGMGVREE